MPRYPKEPPKGAAHQPAFPVDALQYAGDYTGMTKREVIAMNVHAHLVGATVSEPFHVRDLAADAVKHADALLTELERTKP